jgi:3-hydroxyisobutyrate dehydrogenase-like beta-hydroxyacid dehydrogenase
MLFDDWTYEEVLFGANGLVDALSPGAIHISCRTISVAFSERLTMEYAKREIDFVGASVFDLPSAVWKAGYRSWPQVSTRPLTVPARCSRQFVAE